MMSSTEHISNFVKPQAECFRPSHLGFFHPRCYERSAKLAETSNNVACSLENKYSILLYIIVSLFSDSVN